jgi:putative GTP pyrophosphokinase
VTPDKLSGSQLEKLGERLSFGPLTLEDLRQLRRYLETLEPFADRTFADILRVSKQFPELRPARITRRNVKTIRSVLAKLRRQTITLRQIQDLVGCRIVVPDIIDQENWNTALETVFPRAQIINRTTTPQHGYRAVHLIVRQGNERFEIQLRTMFQDEWANIVEKIDDKFGSRFKYGVGDSTIFRSLLRLGESIAQLEAFQKRFEAKVRRSPLGLAKVIVGTYTADYEKAFDEAYPSEQRTIADPFSSESDARWRKAEDYASKFLRLVLWSNVELPVGTELSIRLNEGAVIDHVRIISSVPNLPTVEMPTTDDLQGGTVYEITQPSDGNEYLREVARFKADDGILDDVSHEFRTLESVTGIEEWRDL